MSWETEFAKMLKQRNNKAPIGAIVGEVVNPSPLTISILNNRVILDNTSYLLCNRINEIELTKGDKLLCIAAIDDQLFYVIDKVVV